MDVAKAFNYVNKSGYFSASQIQEILQAICTAQQNGGGEVVLFGCTFTQVRIISIVCPYTSSFSFHDFLPPDLGQSWPEFESGFGEK